MTQQSLAEEYMERDMALEENTKMGLCDYTNIQSNIDGDINRIKTNLIASATPAHVLPWLAVGAIMGGFFTPVAVVGGIIGFTAAGAAKYLHHQRLRQKSEEEIGYLQIITNEIKWGIATQEFISKKCAEKPSVVNVPNVTPSFAPKSMGGANNLAAQPTTTAEPAKEPNPFALRARGH